MHGGEGKDLAGTVQPMEVGCSQEGIAVLQKIQCFHYLEITHFSANFGQRKQTLWGPEALHSSPIQQDTRHDWDKECRANWIEAS